MNERRRRNEPNLRIFNQIENRSFSFLFSFPPIFLFSHFNCVHSCRLPSRQKKLQNIVLFMSVSNMIPFPIEFDANKNQAEIKMNTSTLKHLCIWLHIQSCGLVFPVDLNSCSNNNRVHAHSQHQWQIQHFSQQIQPNNITPLCITVTTCTAFLFIFSLFRCAVDSTIEIEYIFS